MGVMSRDLEYPSEQFGAALHRHERGAPDDEPLQRRAAEDFGRDDVAADAEAPSFERGGSGVVEILK